MLVGGVSVVSTLKHEKLQSYSPPVVNPLKDLCYLLQCTCGWRLSTGYRTGLWPRRLPWWHEDDVPEWIDKGFVINEKQLAYESKNVKKRKICVVVGLTDRRTESGQRTGPLTHWRSVVIIPSTTTRLTSSSTNSALNFDVHAVVSCYRRPQVALVRVHQRTAGGKFDQSLG